MNSDALEIQYEGYGRYSVYVSGEKHMEFSTFDDAVEEYERLGGET